MTGEDLAQAQTVLDAKRLTLVDRASFGGYLMRTGVPQRLRNASHYQARVHPQDHRRQRLPRSLWAKN
jgi:hypothetical protein